MAIRPKTTDGFTHEEPVRFLDGSSLARPLDMPKSQRGVMYGFVIAAAVIGIILFVFLFNNVLNASSRDAATVEATVNRGVSLDLPVLTGLVQADDASILNSFAAAGFTTYPLPAEQAYPSGFDIVKLPSDVTAMDAAIAYASDLKKLSAADASKYLSGSWRMTVSRSEYVDMKVRYADFSSGSVDAAVRNAIASQGLAGTSVKDSGIDSAGNTFVSGAVDVNGSIYQWQVSACPLTDVYSISGLPASAAYVGIRLHQ